LLAETTAYLDAIQREHRVILKAIRLRNKEAARDAARHHLPNAYECYRNRFPDKPATVADRARSDIERFPRVRA
jgi:DNA-binding FadR family transcriptional regulator